MNEVTLPPSPNWYLSTSLACSRDGTVAWGSRNSIVVGRRQSAQRALTYSIISDAHIDKINSLAFCPDFGQPGRNYIVTGGNDCTVKVWDLDTLKMNSSKKFLEPEQKVIAVDWSKNDPNQISAITVQGSLLTWQFSFKTHQVIHLSKMTATCMSCCPHNSNLIAIGTKSGLILIVSPQGKTIHKLRGHNHEIVSLSWCPTPLNILQKDFPKDCLLASGAKDRTIYLWKAATDGRWEAEIPVPNTPQDNSQHRSKLGAGPLTVLLWVEPGILLANSCFGELLSLRLASVKKSPRNSRLDWRIVHGSHSRAIFSISGYVEPQTGDELKPSDDENWRTEKEETVAKDREIWTTGQERQVICTVPGEEDDTWRIKYNIPTLGGYVYCLSPCPVDTSRVAIGVGSGVLQVWNLSEPHETTFDVVTAWQDIKDRVTAVAWHPDKENLLAYGTSEGRVGVYDIFNVSKRPIVFKIHHKKTIYRLEWGPSPPDFKSPSTYSLYCCGDGELTCFNYDKPLQAPRVILKKGCTEASWKPDYSCLAVGHDSGSISFLTKNLESCGKTIFLLKKPVECLTWHPDSTATDLNFSHFRNYLAASTTNSTITIFDMSGLSEKLSGNTEVVEDFKVVANLTGHSDRIFSLAWSPHISGYLVSGSADKTVQVWKMEGREIIATYTGHCGGVQSVLWSPLNHNLIMSGSADWSLRIWKHPEQQVILPSPESAKSKSKKSSKKPTVKTDGATSVVHHNTTTEGSGQLKGTDDKEKKRTKKVVSYFPNYRKQINDNEAFLNNCLELAEQVNGTGYSQTIFGTQDAISEILKIEREDHWEKDRSLVAVEMSLWDNHLKETIMKAMETQSLSDFMVSLAPSLSLKFWKDVCVAYAHQLVQEGNHMKAASYLLGIHKIHEAVQVLMEGNLLREAYVIARCRLDPQDEVLKAIQTEWQASLIRSGFFEEAALCYINSRNISEAARILARRKDISTLETAAKLARIDGNHDLSKSIIEDAVTILIAESNYETAKVLLKKFPNERHRVLQIEAHEELKKNVGANFHLDFVDKWLRGERTCGFFDTLKEKFVELEKTMDDFSTFYSKLEAVSYATAPINQTEPMLWLSVSRDFALAAAAPDDDKIARHIAAALGTVSQYELLHPVRSAEAHNEILVRILATLERFSPAMEESIFYFEEGSTLSGERKTLRVYLCLGLLNWLLDRIQKSQGSEEDIAVEFVAKFIEESLEFILESDTVQHWLGKAEISKLERMLTTSNTQEEGEVAERGTEQTDGTGYSNLVERLETVRQTQKEFIESRVCVPSPMLIYSKASQLGALMEDEDAKKSFLKTVNSAWKKATKLPSEI